MCYTCVRECPAKAIRIADGQARVVPERCIACGNCVRVCSQGAKRVKDSGDAVHQILASKAPVVALLAPSFPAEFTDLQASTLVGMIRALGFRWVVEVAFGADLVARRYRELLAEPSDRRYIATTCPAIVEFIQKYHPNLLPSLAPVVSPMVAAARAVRHLHGQDVRAVFIGPCIAKKAEVLSPCLPHEVDAAFTFGELRNLLEERNVRPEAVPPSEFDPPLAGWGALFSLSRGMLQAARIDEDLVSGEVVAADGRSDFVKAIEQFEAGSLDARLLEVLCCNGCIMGAGMTSSEPLFSRRSRVSRYVRQRMSSLDAKAWEAELERFAGLDLSRSYGTDDQRIPVPSEGELKRILARMGKVDTEDELNCGACGYESCHEHAMAIYKGLAEKEMCLPYTIDQLRKAIQEINVSHMQLADTQEALMQSERLASMGQLAAGIAHEVNNPLGVVLMYAHLLLDELPKDAPARQDLATIVDHADRCKKIVSGLLNFARQHKVLLQSVNVRDLVSRSMRALPVPEKVTVQVNHEIEDPVCDLDSDQMTQVLTNLINNAFQAMPNGGTLVVSTSGTPDEVRFNVSDSGTGIPEENVKKIFEPFFTTKQIGKGTGLGLTVTYGIVKMHRGDIQVQSNADPETGPTGTTFTVTIPRHEQPE
jgi:iron only hydrogenase large subunit-like protein/nitrogen-specific signal transduction histidine kinase